MSSNNVPIDGSRDGHNCTTTASFVDYGITDGSDPIQETYYRLSEADPPEFVPTPTSEPR